MASGEVRFNPKGFQSVKQCFEDERSRIGGCVVIRNDGVYLARGFAKSAVAF
jgi:hypothetical protein